MTVIVNLDTTCHENYHAGLLSRTVLLILVLHLNMSMDESIDFWHFSYQKQFRAGLPRADRTWPVLQFDFAEVMPSWTSYSM